MIENILVNRYKGFTKVSGDLTFSDFINEIKSAKHSKAIEKIAALVADGRMAEAQNSKKQLPFFTVTANYREKRLPESILRYNDVLTIDVDGLSDEQVVHMRPLIEADPAVLANFLTPKRHGFKIFVYLTSALMEHLRLSAFTKGKIAWQELEHYHAQAYEAARRHFEQLLGVPVDTSGKDIGRGVYASYDPNVYLNEQLLQKLKVPDVEILPPVVTAKKSGRQKVEKGNPAVDITGISTWDKASFAKAVAATRRTMRFEEGKRDTFLFTLGNKCYRNGLSEEVVKLLARREFESDGLDVELPIANAYQYTDKTETAIQNTEEKRPVVEQVIEFIDEHYDIRRNIILDKLEYAECADNIPQEKRMYIPMRRKDFNTVYMKAQLSGLRCSQNMVYAIIDSNYARPYSPFEHYFCSLPPWDGQTDYINELANTVTTTDQAFWQDSFKHWLVGMVACALYDEVVNHLVIILNSSQGKGKSTWIRNLLPPCLRDYYRNGMINPENKDHALLLATHILINMEEFEGMRNGDVAALKRLITLELITERKAYDTNVESYKRHASFIGSTNEKHFLQDFSGSRRFICPTVEKIDYLTKVNYTGVYSQVMHLLRNGYRYWYEGHEISEINDRNEQHRMKDPIEELLYIYFRKPVATDLDTKWKPAASLLVYLSIHGRVLVNKASQQNLIKVLEKGDFIKRTNEQGVDEYAVIQFCMDEVERNFKRL